MRITSRHYGVSLRARPQTSQYGIELSILLKQPSQSYTNVSYIQLTPDMFVSTIIYKKRLTVSVISAEDSLIPNEN